MGCVQKDSFQALFSGDVFKGFLKNLKTIASNAGTVNGMGFAEAAAGAIKSRQG